MIKISFASLNDLDDLMEFMDKYWKKDHILSYDKELFLYEFLDGNKLNITIAKDEYGKIVGLFGFIKYNSLDNPDIGGSLWKVIDDCKEPLLGLKLRDFTIKNVKHRFFAAPGAGLQTKAIYKVIGMNWNRMEQFFFLNPEIENYRLVELNNQQIKLNYPSNEAVKCEIELIKDVNLLKGFDFDELTNIVPFKDFNYISKRFFNHPIYNYDVYIVRNLNTIKNIFVCRTSSYQNSKAYRIVDFYGKETYLSDICSYLFQIIKKNQYEYCDFINSGFSVKNLVKYGFNVLDFEANSIIIPNYFEPFIQKNIPIYCVSDINSNLVFRQCKADGDQDRPNIRLKNE